MERSRAPAYILILPGSSPGIVLFLTLFLFLDATSRVLGVLVYPCVLSVLVHILSVLVHILSVLVHILSVLVHILSRIGPILGVLTPLCKKPAS